MAMLTLLRSSRRRMGARPAYLSAHRQSHLAGYLLLGYGLLIVTGSLYPFAGWRWPPDAPWAFLGAPWPRYLLSWEIPLNVVGYVPWGLLLAARVLSTGSASSAVAGAFLGGTLLSLGLEALQVFIPGRIASNLDVASNALGALLGGMLAVVIERVWGVRERLRRMRNSVFVEGTSSDLATTLLLAWLFAQINPALGLLGTAGYISTPEQGASLIAYSATSYFLVEALLIGMNALYLLVLLRLLTRSTPASLAGLVLLVLASVILKSIGGAVLLRVPAPVLWATPGALAGVLLAVVVFVPWSRQWAGSLKGLGLAAFAGVLLTAVLLPVNPYLSTMLQPIASGHLSHLMGATWWAAQVWPWLVLLCIAGLPAARSSRRFHDGR